MKRRSNTVNGKIGVKSNILGPQDHEGLSGVPHRGNSAEWSSGAGRTTLPEHCELCVVLGGSDRTESDKNSQAVTAGQCVKSRRSEEDS